MTRKETLHAAEVCVCGQREEDYGSPEDNFRVIAQYWEVYIRNRCASTDAIIDICPDDVANMMALLKIGRITTGINAKEDNYVDACGYMACAAEIATGKDINVATKEEEALRATAKDRYKLYCADHKASGSPCHECWLG